MAATDPVSTISRPKGGIANIRINLASVKSPEVRSRYEDMAERWEQMLNGA